MKKKYVYFFIYYLKTEIAPHLERNDFLHIFTKTTIPKKFVIFVQIRNFKNTFTFITTDTSKNGFIYLFKTLGKLLAKDISQSLSIFSRVFLYFVIFLFYTELVFTQLEKLL